MKVLVADTLSETAVKIMAGAGLEVDVKTDLSEEKLAEIIPGYDGLIVRSGARVTRKVLEAGKRLKVVGRAGVGTDNIDKEYAATLGICVKNTPTGNTNAAAEHTLALLMMLAKHIVHSNESLKSGKWERKEFVGTELKGKVLGIIGFGNVGKKVARVALALEMRVLVHDPFVDGKALKGMGVEKAELEKIIGSADYITVHVPLNDRTKNMISDAEFGKMKDGVRILNVARGGVIDEDALLKALDSGKVAAAGLDVYREEPPLNRKLVEHKKVIATPHLGASTKEAQENVAVEVAEQMVLALKEGKLNTCINDVRAMRKTE